MIDEIYNYRQNTMNSYHFSDEWEKLSVKFENTLTEEQLKMFHKLCDLQSATAADETRNAYKSGFNDGVALMIEVKE